MDTPKNSEGYTDFTAYKAIKAVDGAETKAYHLYKTILNVARLAGFTIEGTVILKDRTGKAHNAAELMRRREGNVESLFKMRQDTSL